ncbi:MAG: hypothetical protein AAGA43_04875 [Bacteroidota bacterium]
MFETTFVSQLNIGMVSLPRTIFILIIIEATDTPGFTIFGEPFSPTNDLSIFVVAGRLQQTIIEKVFPSSSFFSIIEFALTRDKSVLKKHLKWAVFRFSAFIDS